MKKITILSGKGGVGKSSITASLAIVMSKNKKIVCADCDVDASNLSLLFSIKPDDYSEWKPISTNQVAEIDQNKCINCGRCIETCYFDAIKQETNIPEILRLNCEGCGACSLICPENAITMKNIINSYIGYSDSGKGFKIASAQLLPGSSGSGKVVAEVRKKAEEVGDNADIMLIDSAAGIGCPVIASVSGTDYAIVVTEPSPSGFSDMKKALEITEHFNVKSGIIINKYDLNNEYSKTIEKFAKNNCIKVLKKIKFDKSFSKAMVEIKPIVEYDNNYMSLFEEIRDFVLKEMS